MDVIENQTVAVPGSISTYDLRAQDPHGPFGGPMLSLVSGHYPTGPGQVAVTDGVAATFGLKVGDVWHQGGQARRVTGIVENPQSLLDEFALVVPGQVTAPTQVTVLFNAPGVKASSIGPNVESRASAAASNPFNPETIVLGLATIGMLLIALVAIGGFTVLAQRRLRSLGMLGAVGATDRNVRLVVRANGLVVGVAGTVLGAVLGLAAWLAYRPRVESSAHHVIGPFQLPWAVIAAAMVLAVLATYIAAARPARAVTRVPIVAALSGRPAPPKQVHRSALPGVIAFVIGALLLWYTGKNSNGGGALELVLGLVALVVAVILFAPLCLAGLARLAGPAPVAVRLALRDLARYRARSGSALAAISLGVLIAVLVCVLSAQRYGNVLDYAGPNLASNQLIVYTPNGAPGSGPGNGPGAPVTGSKLATDGGHRPRHGGLARLPRRRGARIGQRVTPARRGRSSVQRARLRRHPPAAPGLRDQGVAGRPHGRHPHYAARPGRAVQDAAHLRHLRQRPGRPRSPERWQPAPPTPARRAVASPTRRSRRSAPFRPARRPPTR